MVKMVNFILFIVYHKKKEQQLGAGKRTTVSRHKNEGSIEYVPLRSKYSDRYYLDQWSDWPWIC